MYGNSPGYRPGSGGRGRGRGAPPPPAVQQPAQPPNPNYQQNPYQQNPNTFIHNSALFAANQFMQSLNYSLQNPNFSNPAPNFQAPNFRPRPVSNQGLRPQQGGGVVERIDAAVTKARRDLIAAKESVSAWKVSQSALLSLQAESWESLGLQMQQVPSLNRLIATEGKINAFIHCFAAVQRITSLYDLEVAICKNEGIRQFEELEMGPLLRHPLVIHYFCVDSDVTEVYKITSTHIISYLCKFMDSQEGKEISIEEFMEFVAKERPAKSKGQLGVRIQNLGTLITYIQEARRSESGTMKKVLNTSKQKSMKEHRKRPLLAFLQKKKLDDRYSSISERVKSFSTENGHFGNTHIRFISSESEDDDGDDSEDEVDDNEKTQNHCGSQDTVNCDRVSNCPYPSAAEEISRLGLKGETDDKASPHNGSGKQKESTGLLKKRRKPETSSSKTTAPRKLHKKSKNVSDPTTDVETKGFSTQNEVDLLLANHCLKMFVTTWKDACQVNSVPEVFERMLQFYNATGSQRKKLKAMFSSYPCIGLLNIAVTSIKQGMWDSMYDCFQTSTEQDVSHKLADESVDYEMIEVEPTERHALIQAPKTLEQSISVDLIIKKVSSYFEVGDNVPSNVKSLLANRFMFLRRLWSCVYWLNEQFNIKEFESLGYGDFFTFLEKHVALLPDILGKCLASETYQKLPMEAWMRQQQFAVFLSQASNSLGAREKATKEAISALLMRQFPSVSFLVIGDGLSDGIIDIDRENRSCSSRVLFSTMLLQSYNGVSTDDLKLSKTSGKRTLFGHEAGISGCFTTKNAIDALLKAPMLADLESWTHWSLIYEPSLGPFVDWLLCEVNTEELLCLVTRDGKVIRVNHTATVDSFLEASVQRSSFQAALCLLSLLALYGGESHVPLSLLKEDARKAFVLFMKDSVEVRVSESHSINMRSSSLCRHRMNDENAFGLSSNPGDCENNPNKLVAAASRFFIDCLSHLPAEFRSYAADILLSGLRSVMKDSISAILGECKQTEHRLMLHEVGLSLGVVEWIDDYHSFSACMNPDSSICCGTSCSQTVDNEFPKESKFDRDTITFSSPQGGMLVTAEVSLQNKGSVGVQNSPSNHGFGDSSFDNCTRQAFEAGKANQALQVIEHIRREEFGLDTKIPDRESSMLKKQHARLGRALHCLSQELYSQDSHFLLELVQNADDNEYPDIVEPTLSFILQDSGIVVLNNEQGFSVQNIKALCDIGNSTKKGSGAGYIGKKGIGFKSVFRVTNAPEIHSNGFHVKFDISEGQIGFVLPTVIPPCDAKLFKRLAFDDKENMDTQFWNTCIVLPFRPNFAEGHGISSIVSLFSDLHPSLLLFLHRLQCIRFRNMLDSSLIIMRKEIVGNGIVKVSLGKERLTWLVASQELKADTIRSDAHTTEISLAFTLKESEHGVYVPHLEQQPVFAFLPLRKYGLKFIVQGDFVLPSSREEVDGDSPWNQWLLSKFPDLFVDSEKSFCALPCFSENPGKAVTAFMSFVPLVGEVHGFFSSLPRLIISKLRMSKCLLMEGSSGEWVLPCKTIRCWNEQARSLLPDSLLREHLGLGFLDNNIVLSDSLARDLGVEDYGPRILVQILTSLCHSHNGLQSVGLSWLSSCIHSLYAMLFDSYGQIHLESGTVSAITHNLKKVPFIPLSDGTYSSVDEGTIWLQNDALHPRYGNNCGLEAFSMLYAKLRTVNPAFLSAMTSIDIPSLDMPLADNLCRMLQLLGVQRLSAHDIVKVHILPVISDSTVAVAEENLMVEYLSFVMLHLQSSCSNCEGEKGHIITELHNKALILTNDGYKRPAEVSIYCSKEFGNPIDVDKLISGLDLEWYEVNVAYLKHPITKSLPDGMLKWREFFQGIGIADFVHVVPVEKSLSDTSPSVIKNILLGGDQIPNKAVIKDWESPELIHLLSKLTLSGDCKRFKYLLEVFDILWDDCFHHKVVAQCIVGSTEESIKFPSSFISSLRGVQWLVSSMDSELHSANDLFNDCDSIRSILGAAAPYVVPKVQSKNLLHDIGLKTEISPEDMLKVLQQWRSETPFIASVAQMSRFYSFIWNEIATVKQKIIQELVTGPFIFIPYSCASRHEDVVPGELLSYSEVCWHDLTGSENQLKEIYTRSGSGIDNHLCKTLCNLYPCLRDFFVKECGVSKIPTPQSYLQILLQLSTVALPSQAANMVFQVLLQWSDGLKSGTLSSEDVITLRECLLKQEFTVLPTKLDKWVSLHPSFGLVCWCDDEKLNKEFKHSERMDLLYFGQLNHVEKEVLQAKVSVLLRALGIPGLSDVVSREAIYQDVGDSRSKASLVNWVLPYAQRYIYKIHHDSYTQLKKSGFESITHLQIVVVEKLFYRNIIKRCKAVSKKHYGCSCLLEGNVLYATRDSDSHALFLELTSLLFDGTPDVNMANFLNMITIMAESGSNQEQTEYFVLNSQKLPKLPDEEPIWSLPSVPSSMEIDQTPTTSNAISAIGELNPAKPKVKPGINSSSWPPVDWKTAPATRFGRPSGSREQEIVPHLRGPLVDDDSEERITQADHVIPTEINAYWDIEGNRAAMAVPPPDSEASEDQCNPVTSCADIAYDSLDLVGPSKNPNLGSFNTNEGRQLSYGMPNQVQALLTGRVGEHTAFDYFTTTVGENNVTWVNQHEESGLPYDLVIGDEGTSSREYIEVKATKSVSKDWFLISVREWQFAVEKGESFSIAHVHLNADKDNSAKITVFKNPARLCKLGQLKLAMLMPK